MSHEKPQSPPLLPDVVQQRIFGFYDETPPELIVAAGVVGNCAPAQQAKIRTIEQAQHFLPVYAEMPKSPHPIINAIAESVTRSWQSEYTQATQKTLGPNWLGGVATFTPLNKIEQTTLSRRVEKMATDVRARRIAEVLPLPGARHAMLNLNARMLGVAHDLIAMPRILAGKQFINDREQLVRRIAAQYFIHADGTIGRSRSARGLRDVFGKIDPTSLLKTIPWSSPCEDLIPSHKNRCVSVLLGKFLTICEMAAEIAPELLSIPVGEMQPSELHSPLRVTTLQQAHKALDAYPHHASAILKQFFTSQELDLPIHPAPRLAVSAQMAALPHTQQPARPPETEQKTPRSPADKPVLDPWEQHVQLLRQLQESDNPLAQKLIELVTDRPAASVELRREERFNDRVELSEFVYARLRNVARIFYGLHFTEETGIPPSIQLASHPQKLIESIVGDYAGRIQAVHLRLLPAEEQPKADTKLRLAIIVEKRSTGHRIPAFDGAHFSISIQKKVEAGKRTVTIAKYEGAISEAERLVDTLPEN